MTSKSTKTVLPPRGMRDILPQEMVLRQHLLQVIGRVYQGYGYLPIDTPAMERLEILMGKGGNENEKLLFKVLKRGEKLDEAIHGDTVSDASSAGELADMGLRFDLTVPLARYVAANRDKLPAVFRAQHMAPVWRADRPQKGRFREFMQCDIDVIGGESNDYEVEILTATEEALRELDIRDYVLRISDKRLLPLLFGDAGADEAQTAAITTAVDKLDKVGIDAVKAEIDGAILPAAARELAHLLLANAGGLAMTDFAATFGDKVTRREEWDAIVVNLGYIVDNIKALNPNSAVRFDPLLIRGMDYYTGPVFEVGVKGYNFSVVGGGRYDGLIGRFSNNEIPAVGCSIGFDRIMTILQDRENATQLGRKRVRVVIDKADALQQQQLARKVRALGIAVDVDLTGRKFDRRLKAAEGEGFAHIITGYDSATDEVTVRDLRERKSVTVPLAEIAAIL